MRTWGRLVRGAGTEKESFMRHRTGRWLRGGAVALLSLCVGAPLALAASAHGVHFQALHWRVWVPDSTGYARPHTVKLGGRYTLCNMTQLNELEIDYSVKNAATHGHPYTMIISGPGGAAQKVRFAAAHSRGKAQEGWGNGALPPMAANPSDAGMYTVKVRQGSKTLMHASITLVTSNTC